MGSGKLSGMREDRWAGCQPSTTEPWTGGSAGPAGGGGLTLACWDWLFLHSFRSQAASDHTARGQLGGGGIPTD